MKGHYGFGLKEFLCEMKSLPKDQLIKIADEMQNGMLTVWDKLEAIPYDPKNFDWAYQGTRSPNSFQLYLQGQNHICYLLGAFMHNKNPEYLKLGKDLFESWYTYFSDTERSSSNPYLWNDHCTAIRAENLIYFALVLEEQGMMTDELNEKFLVTLKKHGDELNDDTKYFKNCNHGICQDCALIYVSKLFEEIFDTSAWLENAKRRLEEQTKFAFNSECAHAENSPEYHEYVLVKISDIARFLAQFNDSFGVSLTEMVEKSCQFLSRFIKPDGRYAEIGDTDGAEKSDAIEMKRLHRFNSPDLSYFVSRGKQGIRSVPERTVYEKTGYYFAADSMGFSKNSTWVMFKSGYSTRVHKHADDLSFMLYSHGHNIFIDLGKYNYMMGDLKAEYFHSAMGHNTVFVDDRSYSISNERCHLTGIADSDISGEYAFVRGYNYSYNCAAIQRDFYNKDHRIIIRDLITSNSEHKYSQCFHLSEHCSVVSARDDLLIARIADTKYYVVIKQLNQAADTYICINRLPHSETRATVMNKTTDVTTVEFCAVGSDAELVTAIDIIEEADLSSVSDWQFDAESNKITMKNESLIIRRDKLPTLFDVNLEFTPKNMNVLFKDVNIANTDQIEVGWSFIEKKWKKVFREGTVNERERSVAIDFYSECYLKLAIFYKGKKLIEEVAAVLEYDKSRYTLRIVESYIGNKGVLGQSLIAEKNTVRYHIDVNDRLPYQLHWFIYKNGGILRNFKNDEVDYTLEIDSPGIYSVVYYLQQFGNPQEFHAFGQIEF